MNAREPLVLIGGGGHALVVAEAAQQADEPTLSFLDDAEAPALITLLGPGARLGGLDHHLQKRAAAILALGDLRRRRRWLDEHAHPAWTNIVHPAATVSPSARLGSGAFVGAGAVINALARLGAHVIANTACVIEHECIISDNVHIAPGAIICGGAHIGADTLIGAGAVVLPGVTIGACCTIGAAALVRDNIDDDTMALGMPARAIDRLATRQPPMHLP